MPAWKPSVLGALAGAALLFGGAAPDLARAAPSNLLEAFGDPVVWYHLYSASDGVTHVEEMPKPQAPGDWGNTVLLDTKPSRVVMAFWPDGYQSPWHGAGHVNILIYLQGTQVIETGDGKIYRLGPGIPVLADDWVGKGHRYRCEAKDKAKGCLVMQITVGDIDKTAPLKPPPPQ